MEGVRKSHAYYLVKNNRIENRIRVTKQCFKKKRLFKEEVEN